MARPDIGLAKNYMDIVSPDGQERLKSLDAEDTQGAVGKAFLFTKPRRTVSMQVSFDSVGATVKVPLEVTIDGTNWYTVATFDTGAGSKTGDIVSSTAHAFMGVRATAETLSAGTVTATIVGTALGA